MTNQALLLFSHLKCYATTGEKHLFFNWQHLMQNVGAETEVKKQEVTGCSYFKKIYNRCSLFQWHDVS